MLPKRGTAYAVLLLCHAVRLAARRDVADWVRAARVHGTFVAAATDLTTPAEHLLTAGLAEQAEAIVLAPPLAGIAGIADGATLRHIAQVLLTADPPAWLRIAVSPQGVARQYIPTADLRALEWLDPELDDMLIDVCRAVSGPRDAEVRKRIGDAAEAVVLAALRADGRHPTHVAAISDAFGYDIELAGPPRLRIEVKGGSANSRGTFHLSRNEYDKSRSYDDEWLLTQVVFANEAFVAPCLKPAHIIGIFEVSARWIESAVPPDTTEFAWTDSAMITPPPEAWRPAPYAVADVILPGLAR
ncbi:protein NO VEIN domain-containing protein [Micromonospora sp. NPDC005806]|uniref:protein NO VEIN domain-containing protein n=1 Tax=Micromonospora sp. NPDC005806 TaxID=3364234 RepID=UPI003696B023